MSFAGLLTSPSRWTVDSLPLSSILHQLVHDIDIQVSCANLHLEDMSPKALAFGAKALEVSFNNIHKQVDGLTLKHVTATPSVTSPSKAASGVRGAPIQGSLYFAAKSMDGGDLEGCPLCGRDDDTTSVLDANSLKLWQNELEALFAMSPYGSLSKAGNCRIAYGPRGSDLEGCPLCGRDDDLSAEQQQAVTIDVQCADLDIGSAPVKVLSAASKALADSFGAIHSTKGNTLSNIFMAGPRLSFSGNAQDKTIKGCPLCGRDDDAWVIEESHVGGCPLCGRDDDTAAMTTDYAMEFSAIKGCPLCGRDDDAASVLDVSEIATNHAWEQLFMAKMMKEGVPTGACKLLLTESVVA